MFTIKKHNLFLIALISALLSFGQKDTLPVKLIEQSIPGVHSYTGVQSYKNGIIFASDYSGNDSIKNKYLDIFTASPDSTGKKWQSPTPIGKTINSTYHDGPASINKTGDQLIFSRNLRSSSNILSKIDITNTIQLFSSNFKENEWTKPTQLKLGSEKFSNSHPCFSADGKTIYFVSNRDGGKGQTDIYRSTFDGKNWSTPEDLGDSINTSANERFPYMDADTLYFTSDRTTGKGGFDIYKSILINGKFSSAINLASPINSSSDEFYFSRKSNTNSMWLVSNRDCKSGENKLYEVEPIKDTLTPYIKKLAEKIKYAILPIVASDSVLIAGFSKCNTQDLTRIDSLPSKLTEKTDSLEHEKRLEKVIGFLNKLDTSIFKNVNEQFITRKKLAELIVKRQEEERINKLKQDSINELIAIAQAKKAKLLAEKRNRPKFIPPANSSSKASFTLAYMDANAHDITGSGLNTQEKSELNAALDKKEAEFEQTISEIEQLFFNKGSSPSTALIDEKTKDELTNSYYYNEDSKKLIKMKDVVKKKIQGNISLKYESGNPYTRLLDIVDAYERTLNEKKY